MPAATLLLIRHGEADASGRFCGRFDPPLTQLGRQQAHLCAVGLGGVPLAAIYASPLRRSCDTAAALGFARIHHSLMERHFGLWEGQPLADRSELDLRRLWSDPHFSPKGGESMASLMRRAARILGYIAKRHSGDSVAVVTHGGLIRAALCDGLGMGLPGVMGLDIDPGCGTLVQYFADGGVRVVGVNLPPTAWRGTWSSLSQA